MAEQKRIFFIYRNSKDNRFLLGSKFSKDYYSRISLVNKNTTQKNANPVLIIFNCFVQSMRANLLNNEQRNSIVYERDNFDKINNCDGEKKEDDRQYTPIDRHGNVVCNGETVHLLETYCKKIVNVLNLLISNEILPAHNIGIFEIISDFIWKHLYDEETNIYTKLLEFIQKQKEELVHNDELAKQNEEAVKKIIHNDELAKKERLADQNKKQIDARQKLKKKLEQRQIKNINKYKNQLGIQSDAKTILNIKDYIESGNNDDITSLLKKLLNGTLTKDNVEKYKELLKCIMTQGKQIDSSSNNCVNVVVDVDLKTYKELRF